MTKFKQANRKISDLGLFHFHANLEFCLGLIVVPVASLVVFLSRPLELRLNNETKIKDSTLDYKGVNLQLWQKKYLILNEKQHHRCKSSESKYYSLTFGLS